jgi:hypothetical protein
MQTINQWLDVFPFAPIEVDCTTTIMLKILDGKCKMTVEDKIVIAALYEATRHLPGEILQADIHNWIAKAKNDDSETLKMHIYELRLLAETMISRPIMKGFKAKIRQNGLYTVLLGQDTQLEAEST